MASRPFRRIQPFPSTTLSSWANEKIRTTSRGRNPCCRLITITALVSFTLILLINHLGYLHTPIFNSEPSIPGHLHYNSQNLRNCTEHNNCPTLVEWLHSEAEVGHAKATKALLRDGADGNATGSDGMTALHVATAGDFVEVVRVLLDAGVDVNKATVQADEPRWDPFVPPAIGWTALHIAAVVTGNEKVVKLLLGNGADVSAKTIEGATPLQYAAKRGYEKVVRLLLAAGADVDERNLMGATALMEAANEGEVEVVKVLLAAGADVNATMLDGRTALWAAANRGHEDIVKIMLDAGATVIAEFNGSSATEIAAETRHWDILEMLLEAGGFLRPSWHSSRSYTAADVLYDVAGSGREKLVKLLLAAGTDGVSKALHSAARNDRIAIVKMLLKAGADVNVVVWGSTPLYMAADRGHVEIVEILLDAAADVDVKNEKGETALHTASWNGYTEIVELLLDTGVDVNVKAVNLETPLHKATSQGRDGVIEKLLAAGADVNPKLTDDRTPLHNAAEIDKPEIIEMLLAAGAGIAAKLTNGETALHRAAAKGLPKVVKVLLSAGADANSITNNGTTPVQETRRTEVVELLLNAGAKVDPKDLKWVSLWEPVSYSYIKVIEILLADGRDVNDPQAGNLVRGWRVLHMAAWVGNVKVVKLLLDAGADTSVVSNDGQTALDLAKVRKNKEVVELLESY